MKTSFFAQNQDFHSEKHRGNYGILHFHNFIRKFSAFATPKHIISPFRAIELPSPAAPAIHAIPGTIPVFLLPIGHDEIQVAGENAVPRRRRRSLVIYISTRIPSIVGKAAGNLMELTTEKYDPDKHPQGEVEGLSLSLIRHNVLAD